MMFVDPRLTTHQSTLACPSFVTLKLSGRILELYWTCVFLQMRLHGLHYWFVSYTPRHALKLITNTHPSHTWPYEVAILGDSISIAIEAWQCLLHNTSSVLNVILKGVKKTPHFYGYKCTWIAIGTSVFDDCEYTKEPITLCFVVMHGLIVSKFEVGVHH
jgi:hypothetical protein